MFYFLIIIINFVDIKKILQLLNIMKFYQKFNFIPKIFYLLFFFTASILIYPNLSSSNTNGSVGGKTGSPNDNISCLQCHNATSGNNANIYSDIPSDGYLPNETYTISANINQNGINKFGFEITSEEANLSSEKVGTFIIINNETKYTNNNQAITHTPLGSLASDSQTWTMQWQAPSEGTGNIIFYGAFIAANSDGTSAGDKIHFATLNINEKITNTSNDLNQKDEIIFNSKMNIIEIKRKSKTSIYNLKGEKILETNKQIINLLNLKEGIYIIKSGNNTKKIKR